MTGVRQALLALALTAADAAVAQAPLSAIDWLQQAAPGLAIDPPAPFEPPIAQGVALPPVETRPLDAPRADHVGLLSAAVTGLPRDLWASSDSAAILRAFDRIGETALPAVQALQYTLLLAEAAPPSDSGDDAAFLRARLAALWRLGAVEPALALVERAGPATPALFDRWLDLALLTGQEETPCAALRARPWLSADIGARVYCTARAGDWRTAALIFEGARALGALHGTRADLLAQFLDLEETDEAPLTPPASRAVTPLAFRLFEAIGSPLPTRRLPRAFAMADLNGTAGWKAELEAAERLARTGALSPARLLGLYTARRPAASGGVWDRVAAVQALDRALSGGDGAALADSLPAAWEALRAEDLGVALAQIFAPRLLDRAAALPPGVRDLARTLVLLSPDYERAERLGAAAAEPRQRFLLALAQGTPQDAAAEGPAERAVLAGFTDAAPAADDRLLLDQGRLGEAILQAAWRLDRAGPAARPHMAAALATLRAVGLEDSARRVALQILLLRAES